jgi:hypothetical protein
MASLLSDQTTDTTGTGVAVTGPCSIVVSGDSVFDGATVDIQVALNDETGEYQTPGEEAYMKRPGMFRLEITGSYYVRAVQTDSGSSTSITCDTNQ